MTFRKAVTLSLLIIGMLLSASTISVTHAADKTPPLTVKSSLDKASVKIGDPVIYEVTVKRKPHVILLSEIQEPSSEIFKVKNVKKISKKSDGYLVEGKRFEVKAFRLGNFILEPQAVQYRIDDGAVETIETDPIYVRVTSVTAEGETAEDIRGIKGVEEIPFKTIIWLLVSGMIILTLAIFIIYRAFFRKKTLDSETVARLSPEEEALLELTRLSDSEHIRKERYKIYFLRLSEILKIYFEKRLGILAVESTTSEISQSLKNVTISTDVKNHILEVLEVSDLAKFAKFKPSPQEIIEINKKSKQIIQACTPLRSDQTSEGDHAV